MRLLAWKLSTLAALGTSVFFAVHPLRAPLAAAASSPHPAHEGGGGVITRWLGGEAAAPSADTAKLVERLGHARSPTAICQALEALGYAGDGEATRAILDAFDSARRADVRACAVTALGKVQGATA